MQISYHYKQYLRSGGNKLYKQVLFKKNEGDFQNLKFDFDKMQEIESFGKAKSKNIKIIFEKNCKFYTDMQNY